MTLRGFLYIAVEAILFFLSFGTGSREIFVCFICIGVIGVFSLVSVAVASAFLRLNASLSASKVSRGSQVDFLLTVSGMSFFPSTVSIDVGIPGEEGKYIPCAFNIMPGLVKKAFSCKLDCRHRGEWNIRIKKLKISDVFGLFSFRIISTSLRKKNFGLSIYVTPVFYKFKKSPKQYFTESGDGRTNNNLTESGDTYGETRQYQTGDRVNRIHWVQTVRAGELYVRRFEQLESQSVVVLLDCSYKENEPKTADIATETALSLLANYEKSEIPVRLVLTRGNPDGVSVLVKNQADLQSATELLTKVKFTKQTEPFDFASCGLGDLAHTGAVYVISPCENTALPLNARVVKTLYFVPSVSESKRSEDRGFEIRNEDDIIVKVGNSV